MCFHRESTGRYTPTQVGSGGWSRHHLGCALHRGMPTVRLAPARRLHRMIRRHPTVPCALTGVAILRGRSWIAPRSGTLIAEGTAGVGDPQHLLQPREPLRRRCHQHGLKLCALHIRPRSHPLPRLGNSGVRCLRATHRDFPSVGRYSPAFRCRPDPAGGWPVSSGRSDPGWMQSGPKCRRGRRSPIDRRDD